MSGAASRTALVVYTSVLGGGRSSCCKFRDMGADMHATERLSKLTERAPLLCGCHRYRCVRLRAWVCMRFGRNYPCRMCGAVTDLQAAARVKDAHRRGNCSESRWASRYKASAGEQHPVRCSQGHTSAFGGADMAGCRLPDRHWTTSR